MKTDAEVMQSLLAGPLIPAFRHSVTAKSDWAMVAAYREGHRDGYLAALKAARAESPPGDDLCADCRAPRWAHNSAYSGYGCCRPECSLFVEPRHATPPLPEAPPKEDAGVRFDVRRITMEIVPVRPTEVP